MIDLLRLHVSALGELRRRGVLRTANVPTGDLAEHLFCGAFSWERAANSQKGFDASDGDRRFQIKGRRMDRPKASRQLSAIIPSAVVQERLTFVQHTNSNRFMLSDSVWEDERVEDATAKLQQALGRI